MKRRLPEEETESDPLDIELVEKKFKKGGPRVAFDAIPLNWQKELIQKFIKNNQPSINLFLQVPIDILEYTFVDSPRDYNNLKLLCRDLNNYLPDYYSVYKKFVGDNLGNVFGCLDLFINRAIKRLEKFKKTKYEILPRRTFDEKTRYIQITSKEDYKGSDFLIDKDTCLILPDKTPRRPFGYISIEFPEKLFDDSGRLYYYGKLKKMGIVSKEDLEKYDKTFKENTEKQKNAKGFDKKIVRAQIWNESQIRRLKYNV